MSTPPPSRDDYEVFYEKDEWEVGKWIEEGYPPYVIVHKSCGYWCWDDEEQCYSCKSKFSEEILRMCRLFNFTDGLM